MIVFDLEGAVLIASLSRGPFRGVIDERPVQAGKVAAEIEAYVALLRERLPETLVLLNTIYLPPIHALTGVEHNSSWNLGDLALSYNAAISRIGERHRNVLVHDVASLMAFV